MVLPATAGVVAYEQDMRRENVVPVAIGRPVKVLVDLYIWIELPRRSA